MRSALEFIGGLALALATISDVFDTVVVPGGSRASLRVARRLVFATLPLWRMAGRKRTVPASFAPSILLGSFVIWMLLLMLGFGLMVHALRGDLHPTPPSFPQSLYLAGGGLLTSGLSESTATGALRWVLVTSGFCGLAIMTMAVTYLVQVQSGIAQRDSGILKLTTASGEPPSAVGLLERYAALDFREHIEEVLRDGRDWSAQVLQSHASHPTLIYFRSKETGSGWPAALGALLDLSAIVEFLFDAPQWRGQATLLRENGGLMAKSLVELVGLKDAPANSDPAEVYRLASRLRRAGYPVREDPDVTAFCQQRSRHAACLRSMAQHLGTKELPLLPEEAG